MLTDLAAWHALEAHKKEMEETSIKSLFEIDPKRFESFHIRTDGLLFDYSKHRASLKTIELLCNLAKECGLEKRRQDMLDGKEINESEQRAVLHMALRGSTDPNLVVDGENIAEFVGGVQAQIKRISEEIRNNPKITDVVNIGIGGSDLGPRMCYKALIPLGEGPNLHFISNIDGRSLEKRLQPLNPENTLLIVASKTFTTMETLGNATDAREWLLTKLKEEDLHDHIVAVTNNVEKAMSFGVDEQHILPLRDWIGGRYSVWGAVGLAIAVAFGYEVFEELLKGARLADEHFMSAPFEKNIPVLMAMLGIWYRNFWDYPAHAILPYSHDFRDFPRFLQQMDMESNGKSVGLNGERLPYATGPIIFGEAGTNAQHAFMQLLHQSEQIIPSDFLISANAYHDLPDHHTHLISNALAQSKALMEGQSHEDDLQRNFPGNRPSSTFMMRYPDAQRLGMLIAFYEHKVFTQGVVWGINSFDQWGVELGKTIAKDLYVTMNQEGLKDGGDSSTSGLMNAFSTHCEHAA